MGSEPNRFLLPRPAPAPRRKRWEGCLGGLTCFRKQKGGKRIVPASRMLEGNAASNQPNGPGGGLPNQITGIPTALYAPPSSPASFSQSALPSTVQSPNCFLSANSPEGPSSTMFVTGPYAHEPQLVSPPVFSTFTTEPSTAPFTPPPELAHLTTPSSPDVPYAHFLSSSADVKGTYKSGYFSANDLQAAYSLYPGSPASTLISSPASRTPDKEFTTPQWSPSNPSPGPAYTKYESGRILGLQADGVSKSRQDSNFFCPETFAQFYQDQSSPSHRGGRLSISKESEAYSTGGNVHPNRQSKISKPDPDELEAYRASFGFSADEIITTNQYVEISNLSEDSFSMAPLTFNKSDREERSLTAPSKGVETGKMTEEFHNQQFGKVGATHAEGMPSGCPGSYNTLEGQVQQKPFRDVYGQRLLNTSVPSDDDNDIFSNMGAPRVSRNYHFGSSVSDAEIEYRRVRSRRGN